MTRPGHAARHDSAAGRSPFTGSDVCAAAGLQIIPGGCRVSFDQDVWDFSDVAGLPAYLPRASVRFDFTAITGRHWKLVAKEYIYARLAPADPVVAVLPGAYRVPLTLQSCAQRMTEAASWLNWLTGQQITSLGQVTQDHCDRYLIERGRRKNAAGVVTGTIDDASLRPAAAVIIELAGYGELFTADRYAGGFTPWRGRTSSRVVGFRSGRENKTPPLDQQILQPLLAAAFYMTETLGPHVVALRRTLREDLLAREGLRTSPPSLKDVRGVLDRHIAAGEPLQSITCQHIQDRLAKGWAADDPLLPVSFKALIYAAGSRVSAPRILAEARPAILGTLRQVGLAKPWARHAAGVAVAAGTATVPWTVPLDTGEVRYLTGFLSTACLITTAMITGMRDCELKELRAGCRRRTVTGPGLTRYRLAGKLIKGQGPGGTDDEWGVVEEADRAVALAEQLRDDTAPDAAIFGRFSFNTRYPTFRAWVNGPAGQRLGLAPIPGSPVNLRMMRRTLAIELAYRPGGLLAAKVHLKHVSAATTEGYSKARVLHQPGEKPQVARSVRWLAGLSGVYGKIT
jgi:integrase